MACNPFPTQVITCQALRGGDIAYTLPALQWGRRQAASLHARQAEAHPSKQLCLSCTRDANMGKALCHCLPSLVTCSKPRSSGTGQTCHPCFEHPTLGHVKQPQPQLTPTVDRSPTQQSPGPCSDTSRGALENTGGQARTDSLTNSPKRAASRPRGITCRRSPV